MKRYLLALVAAALVVLSPGAVAATPSSGLFGVVTQGPITPVCRVGQPCTGPAANVKITFSQDGRAARTTTTNGAGMYRIALAPGRYTVRIAAGRSSTPTSVLVLAGRFRRVDFFVDTGIR